MRKVMLTHIVNAAILLTFATIPNAGIAQNCVNFHNEFCIYYKKDGYKPLIESRSFQLKKGEFVTQDITLHNGHDYHINIAVDDLFGNQLFFQITDINNNRVIYDNVKDNMNLNLEFSSLETINARITLETPANNTKSRYEVEGCIGLLIETRPTPPTGFLK